MKNILFIGAGNMASAICGGIVKSGLYKSENVFLYDINKEQYAKFENGCNYADSIADGVENADIVFLSVKPQNINTVLDEIKSCDCKNKVFVSICAGITIDHIESYLEDAKIVRAMPNTPLLIGHGVTAICPDNRISNEELKLVTDIFTFSGYVTVIDEKDMNNLIAITSSSPAYIYLFIKYMLDSAKEMGFNYENTLELICKTFIGSANMVLQDSRTVDELIQMVKSPNGTTERALNVLEGSDIYVTILEAMKACSKRADELSQGK